MVQKLLVRQKNCNWEELMMILELHDTRRGPQWLVQSIYKDYHDPAAAASSGGDDDADPQESRDC